MRRAEFIKSLYDEFGRNEILRHGIYMLDYDQEWYDESFHNLEDEETKTKQDIIDSTLSYLSYICYLKDIKVLTDNDFQLFKYAVDRSLINYILQNYFYNLYHFSQKQQTAFPFPILLAYAKKVSILPEEFFDKSACIAKQSRFNKILNF